MGIARFATFSDGSFIAPLDSFNRHEARQRRYQRAMSRKVKFSSNWRKAKARVQRVHARIARVRADFLHKATTRIAHAHALVCVEDLAVRNMSRSAAGTVDAPGRNVRAKSGLNKAILDQGWSEFRRQLDYKLAWSGGHLIAVPPRRHEPDLSGVRSCGRREPSYPGAVPLRGLRPRSARRCGGRDQHSGAGAPRSSLWRAGAVGPLDEAGTRRGDLKWRSSFQTR